VDATEVARIGVGGLQSVVLHRIEGLGAPLCYVQKSYWAAGEAEVFLATREKEALLRLPDDSLYCLSSPSIDSAASLPGDSPRASNAITIVRH
jgi:hypothetical protein